MVPTIPINEFITLYNDDVTLIDVREPHEYVEAHVPGAVLAPLSELHRHLTNIPHEGTVYVICRSGHRSMTAAERMAADGITAISVDDGTLGWMDAGQEVARGTSAA